MLCRKDAFIGGSVCSRKEDMASLPYISGAVLFLVFFLLLALAVCMMLELLVAEADVNDEWVSGCAGWFGERELLHRIARPRAPLSLRLFVSLFIYKK